jgi:acyl carrier protein
MPSREEVSELVKKLLSKQFDVPVEDITDEKPIEKFEPDSLDYAEIPPSISAAMETQKNYIVIFPEDYISETAGNVIDYVMDNMRPKE